MDKAPITLVEAVERHLYQASSVLAQAFHPEWVRERRYTSFLSERRTPALCNGVLQCQASSEETPALIEEILQRARSRSLTWLIGPSTQPTDLPLQLEAHGFLADETVTGMHLDLQTFSNETAMLPTRGLVVVPVETRTQLSPWIQVMASSFGLPNSITRVFGELASEFTPRYFRRFYLGLVDGVPVATSLLFLDGVMAGIYGVATLPEMRLRGYGTTMAQYALREANKLGYLQATLQATKQGESIYRRLGFQEVCTFQTYRFEPGNK